MSGIIKRSFLVAVTMLGVMALSQVAQAQNLTNRYSPRVMEGVRPNGMGGAFIAADGTDENALFYNPAAINDFDEKVHMQFLLPTAEFSAKAISFFGSDLTGLADDIDAAADDAARVTVFQTFAAANTGRYEEVGVHGSVANFMYKWVSASLFYDNRSILALLNPASTTVELEANTTVGLQVGSAYSFWDKALQVGAAVKFVERHLVDEVITDRAVAANANFSDILDTKRFGFGIGFDLGAKGRIPWSNKVWEYLDPVLAITLQNVGHTRFFAGDPVGRMPESLSMGFALNPHFGKWKSIFAMDLRELDHRTDFLNKFHVGYEITTPEITKILRTASARVGIDQGYIAAGVGLDFKYAKINFATWGREVGTKTRQKQSRMLGIQLAAGF